MAKWIPLNEARLVKLHGTGLSDSDIAAQLGVERTVITRRRWRLGLARNFEPGETRDHKHRKCRSRRNSEAVGTP